MKPLHSARNIGKRKSKGPCTVIHLRLQTLKQFCNPNAIVLKISSAGGKEGEGGQGERWPAPAELAAGLDGLFGILMQQRIRCLYGEKAEKTQDILSFQVCCAG